MPDGHDPGGKVRTLMPRGMEGGASFHGPGDCYRTTLWRSWGRTGERFVFLGMNPSTAGARHNDPTITRECGFAMRDGASGLWKLNVSAYRATRPADLLKATVPLDCPENRAAILSLTQAPKFIVAFGCLHPVLRPIGESIVADLLHRGVRLWCFGTTADGSPKHPLYLPKHAQLVRWLGWAS